MKKRERINKESLLDMGFICSEESYILILNKGYFKIKLSPIGVSENTFGYYDVIIIRSFSNTSSIKEVILPFNYEYNDDIVNIIKAICPENN